MTIATASVLIAFCAYAAEKKPISKVDTDALISETQTDAKCGDDCINFVWWIPQEFWAALFANDTTTPEKDKREFLRAFEPYSILAVCQADISGFGSFKYYSKEAVQEGMTIFLSNAAGKRVKLSPLAETPSDVEIMLGMLKPILKSAVGPMGENLHFYVLSDRSARGSRILDPYQERTLSVQITTSSDELLTAQIPFPLDALFIPRTCPNGRKAHISWRYCPWTGKALQ